MLTREFRLKNNLSELKSFHEELTGFLGDHGVDEEITHDVTLLSEELLANTITHGYQEEPREAIIEVNLILIPESKLKMEFQDDAVAFNPLEAEERDLEDERLGGWGIPLLKALADNLEYQRSSGRNILQFECNLCSRQRIG